MLYGVGCVNTGGCRRNNGEGGVVADAVVRNSVGGGVGIAAGDGNDKNDGDVGWRKTRNRNQKEQK